MPVLFSSKKSPEVIKDKKWRSPGCWRSEVDIQNEMSLFRHVSCLSSPIFEHIKFRWGTIGLWKSSDVIQQKNGGHTLRSIFGIFGNQSCGVSLVDYLGASNTMVGLLFVKQSSDIICHKKWRPWMSQLEVEFCLLDTWHVGCCLSTFYMPGAQSQSYFHVKSHLTS